MINCHVWRSKEECKSYTSAQIKNLECWLASSIKDGQYANNYCVTWVGRKIENLDKRPRAIVVSVSKAQK